MSRKKVEQEIGDVIEFFESAHYVIPSHDNETGHTKYTTGTQPPSFTTLRKLKQRRDDYRPGKVKVYTKQEIEEYERARST